MSSTKVLSVPELLEEVLLNTPQRDILVFQRVSRFWLSIITDSLQIQWRLFFQEAPSIKTPEFNPVLREIFPAFFVLDIVPNVWDNCRSHNTPLEIARSPWYQDVSTRDKVMREDASWRKMFPVQPPAKIESLMRTGGCQCGGMESTPGRVAGALSEKQDEEGGITMGGLWDLVVQLVDSVPDGGFFIEWMGFDFVVKNNIYGNEERPRWIFDVEDGGEEEEEEEDDENDVETQVSARRHAIVVHCQWSLDCFPGPPVACGLAIVEADSANLGFASGLVETTQVLPQRQVDQQSVKSVKLVKPGGRLWGWLVKVWDSCHIS